MFAPAFQSPSLWISLSSPTVNICAHKHHTKASTSCPKSVASQIKIERYLIVFSPSLCHSSILLHSPGTPHNLPDECLHAQRVAHTHREKQIVSLTWKVILMDTFIQKAQLEIRAGYPAARMERWFLIPGLRPVCVFVLHRRWKKNAIGSTGWNPSLCCSQELPPGVLTASSARRQSPAGWEVCPALPAPSPTCWHPAAPHKEGTNLNPCWKRNTSVLGVWKFPMTLGDAWLSVREARWMIEAPHTCPQGHTQHPYASVVLPVPQNTHVSQACLIGLTWANLQPTAGVLPK